MAPITLPLSSSTACSKAFCGPQSALRPRLPARHRCIHIAAAAQGKPNEKAKRQDPVRGAYKDRLRDEYVGFGGAPNKPMGSNYFLWIIVIISALALAAYLTGSV